MNRDKAYTKDPRRAKQFATRKDATAAALSIRWTRGDVSEINVMGFKLWALMDAHCSMLTPAGFDALRSEVQREHAHNFGGRGSKTGGAISATSLPGASVESLS